MRRRIVTTLSIVSALLCIATIILWTRNSKVEHYYWLTLRGGHIECIQVSDGNVALVIHRNRLLPSHARSLFALEYDRMRSRRQTIGLDTRMWAGFRYGTRSVAQVSPAMNDMIERFQAELTILVANDELTDLQRRVIRHQLFELRINYGGWICEVGAPLWLIVILTGMLPVVQICRRMCARRLHRVGHCLVCGYDLRATPDRCPECGSPAECSEAKGTGV